MESSIDEPFPRLLLLLETTPLLFYVYYGLPMIALLLISGLISGSEVAYFSLTIEDLNKLKSSERIKDRKVFNLIREPRRLLATILISNNLVNILIITLSTSATWQYFGDKTGAPELFGLTIVTTILIVLFGEIIPKIYANQNNRSFALLTMPVLSLSKNFFRPVSWFLIAMSDTIERRIKKKGYDLSVEDLNQALELTAQQEASAEEKGILRGIVNFGMLSVKQVMRSRIDITAFDLETDFHELINQINKTGYSRIPVYSEKIDKIEGFLYTKDLLPHLEKDKNFKWQKLLQPSFFVPESKKIDDLFKDFQDKQVHMAIVVDEYGGTEGLITMEDIIEEIVGEINDEFDEEYELSYNKLDKKTYVFEGKTSLNDFCKVLSIDPATFDGLKGESESLGGLLLEIHEKLPKAGEKIRKGKFLFTVVSVDQKRIKRIRVYLEQ